MFQIRLQRRQHQLDPVGVNVLGGQKEGRKQGLTVKVLSLTGQTHQGRELSLFQRESRLQHRCHASGEPPDHSSASTPPLHFLILEGSSSYQRQVQALFCFFPSQQKLKNNNDTQASPAERRQPQAHRTQPPIPLSSH